MRRIAAIEQTCRADELTAIADGRDASEDGVAYRESSARGLVGDLLRNGRIDRVADPHALAGIDAFDEQAAERRLGRRGGQAPRARRERGDISRQQPLNDGGAAGEDEIEPEPIEEQRAMEDRHLLGQPLVVLSLVIAKTDVPGLLDLLLHRRAGCQPAERIVQPGEIVRADRIPAALLVLAPAAARAWIVASRRGHWRFARAATVAVEVLKRVIPGLIAMNPATALAFILAGASVALRLHPAPLTDRLILTARFLALAVVLIGLAKVIDAWAGWNFGIDGGLFTSTVETGFSFPDRVAPTAALNILLLGGAVLGLNVARRSVRLGVEASAVVVGLGSFLAILAYLYGVPSFRQFDTFIPMAVHTAVTFFLLAGAVLLSHTDDGWLAVFGGDDSGGTMARRLIPAAVLVPAVLGWLTGQGRKAGVYGGQFTEVVFSFASIVVFMLLLLWSARRSSKVDLARTRAEQALRESERRFSDMLGGLELVSVMLDRDGRITYCNDYLLRLTGWSREDVIGRDWFDMFVPPSIVQEVRGVFPLLLADTPTARHREHAIVTRSGTQRLIEWNNSVLRSATGEATGTASIGLDITERRHAEADRDRLAEILESTSDMVSIGDAGGHLTYLNNSGRRLLGIGLEDDLAGVAIADFLPDAASHPIVTVGIPTAVRAGIWSDETTLVDRQGRQIAVSQVMLAHKAPDGTIEFLSTIPPCVRWLRPC